MSSFETEHVNTLVIGGGQSGLATGYHLARRDADFLIVDAGDRVGDAWRKRWDSLRLFTPAHLDGLDGMEFPAPPTHFPTKDEMADFLEAYADHFDLPVRLGFTVDRLSRHGDGFMVASGDRRVAADNVVVAMSAWQKEKYPHFAADLDPAVFQIHSSNYRHPSQIPGSTVLVVGAGNSGAEIALELSSTHRTLLAGSPPGHIPFDVESAFGRNVGTRLVGFAFHRVLTRDTPIGKKMIAKNFGKGMPLVRTKPKHLQAAGVESVGRIESADQGRLTTADGKTLEVEAIVWACGYSPGMSWIDVGVMENGLPRHEKGISTEVPGLYFVGLPYLYSVSSHTIHGVSRDAERVAEAVATRAPSRATV